jgi:hypothetical protein
MNLIQRVTDILLKPKDTWPTIEQEPGDVASIYTRYVMLLAAIPAVATFIGFSLIGAGIFGFSYRVPVLSGLTTMVVSYVLSLVSIFLLGLLTNALAPTFGGTPNPLNAFKLVAYGSTAGFVGGIFSILPAMSALGILAGLYSIYLIYTGLPVLMKCPPEKAVGYTAVIIVSAIVAAVVLSALMALITPHRGLGGLADNGGINIQTPRGEVTIDTDKINAATKRLEEANQRMQEAQKSGDAAAMGKAMGEMMSGVAGVTGGGEPLPPQDLKALLPETLGGLARESSEVQSGQAMGIAGSTAKAQYAAGNQRLSLNIVDLGNLSGLAAMAGWANTTLDRETPEKTEKVYKQGGRTIREEFRKDGSHAEISTMLANGVMVELRGNGVDAANLKAALESLNLGQIEGMKRPAKP